MTDVFHNEAADALDRERVRLAIRTIAGLDDPHNDNEPEQKVSILQEILVDGFHNLLWILGLIAFCIAFVVIMFVPVGLAMATTHDLCLLLYILYPWLFSAFTTLIKRNKWYNERFR